MDGKVQQLSGGWLCFAGFEFSSSRRELRWHGRRVDVGQRGLVLLEALLAEAGRPVAKARLIEAGWGGRIVEQSNLTVQIAALRRSLAAASGQPETGDEIIRTVPGVGYTIAVTVLPCANGAGQDHLSPGAARQEPGIADQEDLTTLIGRGDETRAVAGLLAANRLVTILGLGGVGKTRLALRLRRDLSPGFADGVAFIDLSVVSDPAQAVEAIAGAIGAGASKLPAREALLAALRSQQILLLVDNAEHLNDAVGRLLEDALTHCPGVKALVTSRSRLAVPGEAVFRLLPLAVPPEPDGLTAADAMDYDAVRLFVDRAVKLLPDFTLTDEDAKHVSAICRRLDGIALAIEMAVPRLEVLSLQQLAERLQGRFAELATCRTGAPARQRTMRAMFDWSWDLITPRQQRLLQLLSVPAAGLTLDMCEQLATAEGLIGAGEEAALLDMLGQLAQSSLVVAGIAGRLTGVRRYRLLETTRQYALDRLGAEERDAVARCFAACLADRLERAEAEWPATPSDAWLERYGPDADNLRSVLHWVTGLRAEDWAAALTQRLTAASFSLWWELPELPLREARAWYRQALAAGSPMAPAIEARLRLGQDWSDTIDGDMESYPAAAQAARLFRAAGDPVGIGAALWRAASTVMLRDHEPDAATLIEEALSVLAGSDALKWQALCRVRQADLLQWEGRLAAALAVYDQAFETVHTLHYGYGMMVCGGNRSYALFALGNQAGAIECLRRLLPELPRGFRPPVLSLLAATLVASGDDEAAFRAGLDGLGGLLSAGMLASLARSVEVLALVAARSGKAAAGTRLLGFALTHHPADRPRLGPRRAAFEQLSPLLAAALSPEERAGLLADGARLTAEEAVAAANSLAS